MSSIDSSTIVDSSEKSENKLRTLGIKTIQSLAVIFAAMVATNILRFAHSDEGFTPASDALSFTLNTIVHIGDVQHLHVVVLALMIAAAFRGTAHGMKQFAVSRIIEGLKQGEEVKFAERLSLKFMYWVGRIMTLLSIVVLSPVLDPREETTIATIIGSLEPYADDFATGGFTTIFGMALVFGAFMLIWNITTDPVEIPQAVQKELKKRGIKITT